MLAWRRASSICAFSESTDWRLVLLETVEVSWTLEIWSIKASRVVANSAAHLPHLVELIKGRPNQGYDCPKEYRNLRAGTAGWIEVVAQV